MPSRRWRNPSWVLLRKFETNKFLPGAYELDFNNGHRFTCLTGNAQMSCVWLRLFEVTDDLRYLNAALKMNEMLKAIDSNARTPRASLGGVSGSYPVWGRYQPLRYISWGCKFFADALLLEQRLTRSFAGISARGIAMRIVVLSSSVYSETACAMAVRMARLGHVPVGALTLPTLDRGTLLRKLGQWGVRVYPLRAHETDSV